MSMVHQIDERDECDELDDPTSAGYKPALYVEPTPSLRRIRQLLVSTLATVDAILRQHDGDDEQYAAWVDEIGRQMEVEDRQRQARAAAILDS